MRSKHKVLRIVGWVMLGVTLAVLFAFVFGILVQWLWNKLMPAIFNLKPITYWQAVGLIILAKLFFGASGGSHPGRHGKKHVRHWRERAARCAHIAIPHEDWQYYDQYWQEQGKAAFESYVRGKHQPPPEASGSTTMPSE
jgi:hypothetical protein